jgi:4-amino-4-deoxy-L-arabinose transferase
VSIAVFGENAFAVRFFSSVAAGVSAFCVFLLVRRHARDNFAGLLTAAVFLTSFEVFIVSTIAVLDSMFTMFVTAGMTAFFFADMERRQWRKTCLLALFGLFCGLAFLVKGFVAFAVVAVAIVPFLFWQRRATELFKIIWPPIITAALVTLPWCLLVYAREKDFWHYFFWTEHIQRFVSASSAEHPEPFWFFVPCLLGGTFPWVVLLPAVISGLKKTSFTTPLIRYAVCWFLLPFIFFSASRGKLSTYILPCFPPLAILVSMALLTHFADTKKKTLAPPAHLLAGIAAALAIALILSRAMTMDSALYGKHEMWKAVIAVTGLLGYAFVLIVFCTGNAEDFRKKLLYFAAGPAVFMFCAHFSVPDRFIEEKAPAEFLERHRDRINSDDILVSDNYMASAVCWAYKRNDVFLVGRPGELEYGLRYDDLKRRLLDPNNLSERIMTAPLNAHITFITLTKRYVEYRRRLPKPLFEDIGDYFTLAKFVPRRVEARTVQILISGQSRNEQSAITNIPGASVLADRPRPNGREAVPYADAGPKVRLAPSEQRPSPQRCHAD